MLCGVLVPQYDYRPHMTVPEFADTLSAVFDIVDHVRKLQITGGEPLLHTDLPRMFAECFKYADKFEKLWLFTNCSVPIREGLLNILRQNRHKVIVHCSDYGVEPGVAGGIVKMLRENEIDHKYLKYYGDAQYCDGWVDQGDFIRHFRTGEALKQVFASCAHVKRGGSWYVRGGQMHWCGRSIRGCEVGKIPLAEKDYLDIFHGSVGQRRQKLSALLGAEYITACDYCNGLYGTADTAQRRPAGEQLV